jgi:hypothetical protein
VDTPREDYIFNGSPLLTIVLDSLGHPVPDQLSIQSPFPKNVENYTWSSDSTKFPPAQERAVVNTFHVMSLPTSAYPNPSQGRVRIAYQLPSGVSSGEVVLTDEVGREVKRFHVTSAFSDLEIQESDLPSGSYFYRLVTSNGESAAQRIVCEK